VAARAAQPAELDDPTASDGDDVADDGAAGLGRPRRSALVQERSRRTRQRLVRAAMDLWTERGFDDGIEVTTVDEIARAAGVTKGTFYFHFAHKEDILLEFGWGTSDMMVKEATAAVAAGMPVGDTLDRLLTTAARRIGETPRAAVARTIEEFYRRRPGRRPDVAAGHGSFQAAFAILFARAQEMGELGATADPKELAEMLEMLCTGAMRRWVGDDDADLVAMFRYRAAVLLSGARELAASPAR
jgi:AcrR family transcriptional regulator